MSDIIFDMETLYIWAVWGIVRPISQRAHACRRVFSMILTDIKPQQNIKQCETHV